MPIIEGQAIGRVVVTSNIPPMIDIAGDGAAIVDPYSVDSIHHIYSKSLPTIIIVIILLQKV